MTQQDLPKPVDELLRERDADIASLRAKLATLAESGTGYSQQTVDAISKERDALAVRLAAAESRWVPVGERLPEDGYTVLAVDGNEMIGTAFLQLGIWYVDGCLDDGDVTHWLPLPAFEVSK